MNTLLHKCTKKIRTKLHSFITLPFQFNKNHLLGVQISYMPDSFTKSEMYEEFKKLHKSFSLRNEKNNGGDVARLWSFILNCNQIIEEKIEGDFAEIGVWRGNTASILKYYAEKTNRWLYLFDTYTGFDKNDIRGIDADKTILFDDTSLELVQNVVGVYNKCRYIKGIFPSSITEEVKNKTYAVVSIDCDLYEPTIQALHFFYPRMAQGGIFLLHDYSSGRWNGVKKAIDEFCIHTQEHVILMPDKSGSAFVRKSHK